MKKIVVATAAMLAFGTAAHADMKVALGGGWNGKKVPAGQHCQLQGGKGATPPMKVTGIPNGAVWLIVEFNDRDYGPLSSKGGHGTIGYPVKGDKADLYAVPGMKGKLPGKAKVIKPARSSGKYASKGYLPPCSGGKGNRYFADVKAVDANGKTLEKARVQMGRY